MFPSISFNGRFDVLRRNRILFTNSFFPEMKNSLSCLSSLLSLNEVSFHLYVRISEKKIDKIRRKGLFTRFFTDKCKLNVAILDSVSVNFICEI